MAVETIGELAVELEARTQEFRNGLDDVLAAVGRFEKDTVRSTGAAGLSFKKLVGPILAVGAALGAITVGRQLIGIGQNAVRAAAQFETYEVRLKALLGSQEGANKALDSFLKLSSRTPFALTQIVEGASTLAVAAGGSREELDSLTRTTANLAAVTGLGFTEAAGNLQRALSAGIGAADLFRDKGIRKMIEDTNKIPDLTKVSLNELRELFKRTFGPDALTEFGDAAEKLSQTLAGSLSNIGDAADRFRISLGQALSPAVVGVAQGLIIPFFDSLTEKIEDNEEALARFFIEGFSKGIGVMANLVEAIGPVGSAIVDVINWVRSLSREVKIAFEAGIILVKSIGTGMQVLGTGLNAIGTALRIVSYMLGLRTAEEVEEQFLRLNDSVFATIDATTDLNERLKNFGETGPDAVDENTDRFSALADQIRDSRDAVRELAEEQIRLRRERKAAQDEQPPPPPPTPEVDREALKARLALRENQAAVAQAEARYAAIQRGGLPPPPDEELQAYGDAFGDALSRGIATSLDQILEGEGFNFAEAFATITGEFFTEMMDDVLADISEGFSSLFQDLGQQLQGMMGGEGGGFNLGAAFGAAVGLGGKIVSGALRGTSSNVRNEMVRSVVTSTQEVRGLVAGPTNIPIAEVGNAIRDSFAGQLTELKRSNTLLERILSSIRSLEMAGYDTSAAVAEIVAAEFNGSVALG